MRRTEPGHRALGRVGEIPMPFIGIAIHASREPGRYWVVKPLRWYVRQDKSRNHLDREPPFWLTVFQSIHGGP
jgi:hypothetical protein